MSAIHRPYQHPHPGNRAFGGGAVRLIYWGHCDDTRPLARQVWSGERFWLVLRWHRFTAYLRLPRWVA